MRLGDIRSFRLAGHGLAGRDAQRDCLRASSSQEPGKALLVKLAGIMLGAISFCSLNSALLLMTDVRVTPEKVVPSFLLGALGGLLLARSKLRAEAARAEELIRPSWLDEKDRLPEEALPEPAPAVAKPRMSTARQS